jgi:hypothetical protein
MVKPWAEAGYECWCVDLKHSIRKARVVGNTHYVWGDVRSWRPPAEIRRRIAMVFAFPPCTHLTRADARDFLPKGGYLLADALQVFDSCEIAAAYTGAPYMIENPPGRLSSFRRPPDHSFQPWQFGDPWFKLTQLWTGNGFAMPTPLLDAPPPGTKEQILMAPDSRAQADNRSTTPPGFALAVFHANHTKI